MKSKKVKRENKNLSTLKEINNLLLFCYYNTNIKYWTYNNKKLRIIELHISSIRNMLQIIIKIIIVDLSYFL